MNSYYRSFICLITACLFCSFFNISCTSSKTDKFHTKIQQISDNDLLNCYHGINDRIKDIGNDINREESSDQTGQEQVISNMPFLIGGEGYNLNQKRKMVLEELNIRGVNP